MKRNAKYVLMVLLSLTLASLSTADETPSRPRVIVLTDITNEPDDQESLVRFLVSSNEFQVDGLIATTSTWLRNRTSAQNIRDCVAAYGKVQQNLTQHAAGFPTQAQLDAVIFEGRAKFGMTGVGAGNDSAGSEHIIAVVDRPDERPVWVTAWGGTNCLAQAIWKVRETRTPEELQRFLSKIRVYTISDQDDSGPWMRSNFPSLFYIVSPSGERAADYHKATWTGISGDAYYLNGPSYKAEMISNDWLRQHVREGHGPLGQLYPAWKYIMEGDTPSYLNLINNGLGSHEDPSYGGWGGRYCLQQPYGYPGKIWTDSRDAVTTPDGTTHISNQATVWRWREAFQSDFAARMDWCVMDYADANHPPVAVVNHDATKQIVRQTVQQGQTITLHAAASHDPDGDTIGYNWFHYPEAGGDLQSKESLWKVPIADATSAVCQVTIPSQRPRNRNQIHIILEIIDDGVPHLRSYRRIILNVENQD